MSAKQILGMFLCSVPFLVVAVLEVREKGWLEAIKELMRCLVVTTIFAGTIACVVIGLWLLFGLV